ncbi:MULTISPECIES: hypothetical protein [unclassified Microcoleus]|nr:MULTISPECIES: hypothetical protein [unclassified Microcoleus]MCC3520421.1 hypothetical protein [Microcoleus sp. PH2017_20_SFW_D_A]MCC3545840.1 hypothetical protein [Microcoleus sp. PH2017_24_DOB_U_A]MCC3551523.1 hypothetical protein [Microcoleus sp. PH2017_35_SFW_U_B]MCC3564959.1 hypothetical protein [Microcoleus sp. PH2017_31_RDM_U_A]MCC3584095.1 hypothetical protein [Microcoleus sp. PH2017_30_WIL_O_A]
MGIRVAIYIAIVGYVATKNLEAPPTISQRRTAPLKGQREKLRIDP